MEKFIPSIPIEEITKMYEGGKTLKEIAKTIGTTTMTARRIIREAGVNTSWTHEKASYYHERLKGPEHWKVEEPPEGMKEYLKREYVEKLHSMYQIAEQLNVSQRIVRKYLEYYEFRIRSRSEQQSGPHATNFKGGRNICSNGYVEIYMPNHHLANKRGYVYEHQLVAEQKIGRTLNPSVDVVHHIDGNKLNNSPDNLLVLTNSEHQKLHAKIRRERKKVV